MVVNGQNHPDRDKIVAHLNSLTLPLQPADQALLNNTPYIKKWETEKDGKALQKAIDDVLKVYPYGQSPAPPIDAELDLLGQKILSFQADFGEPKGEPDIQKALADIASKHTELEQYPGDWEDDDQAGAKAALADFTQKYRTEHGGPLPPPQDSFEALFPKLQDLKKKGIIKLDSPYWVQIYRDCPIYLCDEWDLHFGLEHYLSGKASLASVTDDEMRTEATAFQRTCPEKLNSMEADFFGDTAMHTKFTKFRAKTPRVVKARDRVVPRGLSATPEADRSNIKSRPKKVKPTTGKHNKIMVPDRDDGGKRVEGVIEYVWDGWLDVKMPTIVKDGVTMQERFNMYPESDYPTQHKAFAEANSDRSLNKAKKSAKRQAKHRYIVNHFTYGEATVKPDGSRGWPRTNVIGYISMKNPDEQKMEVWSRSAFADLYGSQAKLDKLATSEREKAGLDPDPTNTCIQDEVEWDEESEESDAKPEASGS